MGFLSSIFGCKSNSKQEKKTFIVDGQEIKTTGFSKDNYQFKLDNLNTDQKNFIDSSLIIAKTLVSKYSPESNGNPFNSESLDKVIAAWRENKSKEKEAPETIIDNLGAAFGQGIVEELNFEWQLITDEYGTDFTVIDKKYVVNGFPFSSVEKAVMEENPRSLNDIKLVLKEGVREAEKNGEIDLRK